MFAVSASVSVCRWGHWITVKMFPSMERSLSALCGKQFLRPVSVWSYVPPTKLPPPPIIPRHLLSFGSRLHVERPEFCVRVIFTRSLSRNSSSLPENSADEGKRKRMRTTLNYLLAMIVALLGMSYAAVPLYRVFCQVTGIGGASNLAKHGGDKVEQMKKVEDRQLRIQFLADTSSHLNWHFRPLQREVIVYPGETALAFYTATNPTDHAIVGISTYTVLPYEAAKYLNKIQCFCFEEQRLNAKEQVDMPVFFYIDPEYVNDPWLQKTDKVTLSYTFFEAKDGVKFLPQYRPTNQPLPNSLAPA